MEKIKSFTVDHIILEPGIYESRRDPVGNSEVITYDLRVTKPNAEPVMGTGEVHTIEHLAATYLRNDKQFKDKIVYFGPMGCRTGFYLITNGELDHFDLFNLIKNTFDFISNFEGEIPGASAQDCGNYHDNNLPSAKWYAKKYLITLNEMKDYKFEY